MDHDVKGVTGSPDLARTIFDKIDLSEVVIADVTLVGRTPDFTNTKGATISGKRLINSDVAIELGYAFHALTDRRVLMVFNEHYGSHEDLPFDLRHKGGAIVFNLPPDGRCGEFARPKTCFIPKGARSLTEMTMDEQQAYSSNIAAEAVRERLGNPPPDTRGQTPRPPRRRRGLEQRSRIRPRNHLARGPAVRTRTPRRTKRGSGRGEFFRTLQPKSGLSQSARLYPGRSTKQAFVTVLAAFALGYAAALLIHRAW